MEDGVIGCGGEGRGLLLPHPHPQQKGRLAHRSDQQGHSEGKGLGLTGAQYLLWLFWWCACICDDGGMGGEELLTHHTLSSTTPLAMVSTNVRVVR